MKGAKHLHFQIPGETSWPEFGLVEDIRFAWKHCSNANESVAVATLVGREGSTPRPTGSQMLIRENGSTVGYVSGGCVEANIAEFSKRAFATHSPIQISLGAGSKYVDIQLPCGSRIDVVVDPIDPRDKAADGVFEAAKRRIPVAWVGGFQSAKHQCISIETLYQLVDVKDVTPNVSSSRPTNLKNGSRCGFSSEYYWKIFEPALRLIVNGNDPIALATAQLASVIGFEVVLNSEFGPSESPSFTVDDADIDVANFSISNLFSNFSPDPWTAVVSTTHDLEKDHELLVNALPSPCFYVGVLGSRRHLSDRMALLRKAAIGESSINRLSAPVGLDINASTPFEIALSIVAEIVSHQHKKRHPLDQRPLLNADV